MSRDSEFCNCFHSSVLSCIKHLFGISSKNVETVFHKYISDMTDEQISNLLEIVKAYAKTCDINLADK